MQQCKAKLWDRVKILVIRADCMSSVQALDYERRGSRIWMFDNAVSEGFRIRWRLWVNGKLEQEKAQF